MLILKYSEVVKILKTYIPHDHNRWNKNYGLSKVRSFLTELRNPQQGLKFIHVGGTSGKGSTATILASILTGSGYKTGLHVSPDVITIRERMQINGAPVSKQRFVELYEQIKPVVDRMPAITGIMPSYFEILLAMTLIYFKTERCDLVVIEVGLGGKLDATNIIDCQNQIITNVGLDHTAILGATRELILKDKQEIIKPGSVVVSGVTEPGLQTILQEKVEQTSSTLFLTGRDFQAANVKRCPDSTNSFDFIDKSGKITGLKLGLPGLFQVNNAALAIMMARQLAGTYKEITEASIRQGVATALLPGRFQIFSNKPLGIIDGAHNPDKISALVQSVQYYYPGKRFITLFRFKKRQDITQSIEMLKLVSDQIIMTRSYKSGDMGIDPVFDEQDQKRFALDPKISFEAELGKAYKYALQFAKERELGILVTGSLYMINEFLENLK